MTLRYCLTTSAAILALVACVPEADPHVAGLVGTGSINRHIAIEPIPNMRLLLPNNYELMVVNKSADPFLLPDGFHPRVFVYSASDGGWVEVENKVREGNPDEPWRLEKAGHILDTMLFAVWPDLDQVLDGTTLRIVVIGEGPRGDRRAAYLDIPIEDQDTY